MVKIVILCGGIGSRLWPISRKEKPKQFFKLPNAKYNLLQETILRINKLEIKCSEVIIISNINIREDIIQSLENLELGSTKITYIWEPLMKNTGPAIGLLLTYLDDDDNCIIWPSDHILDMDSFNKSISLANNYIANNIITFGMLPTYPETGYGYIISGIDNKIEKFIEKPIEPIAKKIIENPSCYWNSGIFYVKIKTLRSEYQKIDRNILGILNDSVILNKLITPESTKHIFIDKNIYQKIKDISFDKFIMERTLNGRVIPFKGLWSDIGSWDSLSKIYFNEKKNNVIELDNDNCHIFNYNDQQIITTIGLTDICVVNMKDALLISKLSQTQKVKDIYQQLDSIGSSYIEKHLDNDYSWGSNMVLDNNSKTLIKKYIINENNFYINNDIVSTIFIVNGVGKIEQNQNIQIFDNENRYIIIGHQSKIINESSVEKLIFIMVHQKN